MSKRTRFWSSHLYKVSYSFHFYHFIPFVKKIIEYGGLSKSLSPDYDVITPNDVVVIFKKKNTKQVFLNNYLSGFLFLTSKRIKRDL